MKKRGVSRVSVSVTDLAALREKCDGEKPCDPQKCVECLQSLANKLEDSPDPTREMELLRFLSTCCLNTSRLEQAEAYLKRIAEIVKLKFDSTILYNTDRQGFTT